MSSPRLAFITNAPKSTGTAQSQIDEFWEKNKKLNRPMSPHLTAYNLVTMTAGMSVTHRATGIYLTAVTCVFAQLSPFLPENLDQAMLVLQSDSILYNALLFDCKLALLWPIVYHTLNGVRHLAWDTGKGFKMNELYLSGYAVIGLSFLITVAMILLYAKK